MWWKDVNNFDWQGWPPFSAYRTGSRWHWRRRLCQTWTWTTWSSKTRHVPWPPTSPTSLASCPSPPAEPKSRFAFSSVCLWSWQWQRGWQLGLFLLLFWFKQEDGDYINFANSITSFQLPNETIVRRRMVHIDFSCRFPKLLTISSGFNMHDSDFIFTETNFGTFGYSFDIYPDSNFTAKMQARAYPVSVKLLQTIYMGIQAQSHLPNVKLFVESCRGTPDDNSDNPIYYDLIKDGWVLLSNPFFMFNCNLGR